MADRLTQMQDCLDQLNTQFYASLRYISLHHSASPLPSSTPQQPRDQKTQINGQSSTTPSQSENPDPAKQPIDPQVYPPEQRPDSPTTFAAAQKELAHDLIIKTKQIQELIALLPGVGSTQEAQEERIRELEGELKGEIEKRRAVEGERADVARRVDDLICGIRK